MTARPFWIVPRISDYSCRERLLATVDDGPAALAFSAEDVISFSGIPLAPLGIERFVQHLSRTECGQLPIDDALPFEVRGHSQAKSVVALSMIDRHVGLIHASPCAYMSLFSPSRVCVDMYV